MLRQFLPTGIAAALLLAAAAAASADVFAMPPGQTSLLLSTVGDAGNAPDTRYGASSGAVAYVYQIGTYEVTTAQYTQFLNAVAKDDPAGLYNPAMAGPITFFAAPAGITRSGSPGSYSYTVITGSGSPSGLDHSNYPVDYISWGDAARFVNWLHNGQPTAPQGPTTTEDGAYTLLGATTVFDYAGITHNAGAKFWIPTEDEWYKAAYYKGSGTSAGYWDYATQSSTLPGNSLSPLSLNNANYFAPGSLDYPSPIDYLTNVGSFGPSFSAYGTFDQTGNLDEYTETSGTPLIRVLRGGYWGSATPELNANHPLGVDTVTENYGIGFRIAAPVPEPTSATLLSAAALLLLRRKARHLST